MRKEQFFVAANKTGEMRFVEVKDVSVVAAESGRWKIYVENASDPGQKNDLFCTATSRPEVVKYIGRFVQFYRENRRHMERTHDFVKRISIQTVRRVLLEDSNGICSRLDAEIQGAVQTFRDSPQGSPERVQMPAFPAVLEAVGAGVSLFERKRHTA